MVANLPYGERIGSAEELAAMYPKLGDALKKTLRRLELLFFTADLRMAKLIRLQPSRRTPLWNGSLECRLFEFKIVSGSNRADARASGCARAARRARPCAPGSPQPAGARQRP